MYFANKLSLFPENLPFHRMVSKKNSRLTLSFLKKNSKNSILEKNVSISINLEKGLEDAILVCCFSYHLLGLALHREKSVSELKSKRQTCFNITDF